MAFREHNSVPYLIRMHSAYGVDCEYISNIYVVSSPAYVSNKRLGGISYTLPNQRRILPNTRPCPGVDERVLQTLNIFWRGSLSHLTETAMRQKIIDYAPVLDAIWASPPSTSTPSTATH